VQDGHCIGLSAYADDSLEGNFESLGLDKSEQPVWLFQNAGYYTTRTETDHIGGGAVYSLRLIKDGSVRSGSFQTGPIKKEHLSLQAVGKLVIATSNVYFVSTADDI
jgi:hypothetical protein